MQNAADAYARTAVGLSAQRPLYGGPLDPISFPGTSLCAAQDPHCHPDGRSRRISQFLDWPWESDSWLLCLTVVGSVRTPYGMVRRPVSP